MTDPKSKGISEWQRESSAADDSELKIIQPKPASNAPTPTESDLPAPRANLVGQATAWLSHPHIINAPIEGKVSFLEGKGLTTAEIRNVLDLEKPDRQVMQENQDKDVSRQRRDTESNETTAEVITEPKDRDASYGSTPPIVTYPEFLLKPPPKPPLISRGTLLRTAYGTAIAAGALHLTSKYLVEPMLAELNDSRRQLLSNTSTLLKTLNGKLSVNVSVVPATAVAPKHRSESAERDEDTESDVSDPAELFHRDIAVQTSEPPSPSSTPDMSSASARIESQSAKLQALRAHLNTLHDSCTDAVDAMQGAAGEMTKLDALLDDLTYSRGLPGRKRQALLPQGASWMGGTGAGGKDADVDEIERVKAEIKGVKGVLLSARSFPSTTRPASVRGT